MTGLLTGDGKKYVLRMLRELTPHANRLDRRFTEWMKKAGVADAQRGDLLAITPAAAARTRSLGRFQKQLESGGRRLAKWNVSPAMVEDALATFDQLASEVLEGQFGPAREQLRLATHFLLNQAFYAVRETESQVFFGLYQAETEAQDLDALLSRYVSILAKAFHASAGRLVLEDSPAKPGARGPVFAECGEKAAQEIAGADWRGRYACYWAYPLGDRAVLQLAFAGLHRWLPRDRALLDAAALRCQQAMERSRTTLEIRRLEAEARSAEEEERRRIGRDLHDEAGQSLAFLRLQLDMLARDAPEALQPRLAEARDVTARTTVELRRIIAALSPSVLERLGLNTALRLLAKRFRFTHPAELKFRAAKLPAGLPRQVVEVIYRVAQECLQNVAKHSQATRVNVSLRFVDKNIRLSVRDNGAGFTADTAWSKPKSFGLAGMRERALLLGGSLVIDSAPGKGTRVMLEVPAQVMAYAKN